MYYDIHFTATSAVGADETDLRPPRIQTASPTKLSPQNSRLPDTTRGVLYNNICWGGENPMIRSGFLSILVVTQR